MQVDLSSRGLQAFSSGELSSQAGAEAALLHVTGLNLSRNSLGSVHGLQGFVHLTTLDLSFNGLTSLDGGLPLGLVSLNVSHNSLSSLHGGALYPLKQLAVLNVACNRLVDLRGVSSGAGAPTLRMLDASGNQLASLNGIEPCKGLEELHVQSNLLREAASVASLRQLPRLRTLLITDNPMLLRKRQVQALLSLLPAGVQVTDMPPLSTTTSVNTSTVSASTAATAVEIEEMRRTSANASREAVMHAPQQQQRRRWQTAASLPLSSPERAQPTEAATPARRRLVSSPGQAEHHTGRHRRSNGTSPLDGVGGEEVSPVCPRKSLPSTPPPLPPLQPYDIPSPGTTTARPAPLAPVNAAEARMLRSSLLERVVGMDAALKSLPAPPAGASSVALQSNGTTSSAAARLPNTSTGSQRSTQALGDLIAERDAYKQQVEAMTEELAELRQALELEREHTALVLCINDQLQHRLQRILAGDLPVKRQGTPPLTSPVGGKTSPSDMPPLAPLPPAPAVSSPARYDPAAHVEVIEKDTLEEPAQSNDAPGWVAAQTGAPAANGAAMHTSTGAPRGRKDLGQADALAARRKAAALMEQLRPAMSTSSAAKH